MGKECKRTRELEEKQCVEKGTKRGKGRV